MVWGKCCSDASCDSLIHCHFLTNLDRPLCNEEWSSHSRNSSHFTADIGFVAYFCGRKQLLVFLHSFQKQLVNLNHLNCSVYQPGVACPGNRCARPTLVDPAWPVDPCPNNTCCLGMPLSACLDNRSHVPNNRG